MSDAPEGPGWWLASDGKWYHPALAPVLSAPGARPERSGPVFSIALIPAVLGWLGLAYTVTLFGMSADVACTAHRGDVYRDCVRHDDLSALRAQGWIMGFASLAFGLVVVALVRQRSGHRLDRWARFSVFASVSLMGISVMGWLRGVRGMWAPDRPYAYDPISAAHGSVVLLRALLIGLVIGVLLGAGLTSSRAARNASTGDPRPST